MEPLSALLGRWFDSDSNLGDGARGSIVARWIFLRALAGIYFSAFFSLLFQIKGLIGPQGILPAGQRLAAMAKYFGATRYWHAPTLYWISAGSPMLMAVTWIGLIASLLAFCNVWPRINLSVCFVCFLSFVSAAGDFSGYQSDGMLLEAGFLSLFFAPPGIWPGWAADHAPSRASLFLLRWEWFRIYFESGLVKLLSGDTQWRNFTAMDEYYQNSPLPTWIGWYVEHLPHWFNAGTVVLTLLLELVVVWMLFFPRRVRMICFLIVTPWEIGVILTGNYAFLNYIVLALGFLLLDDVYLRRWLGRLGQIGWIGSVVRATPGEEEGEASKAARRGPLKTARLVVVALMLTWVGYATVAELSLMVFPYVGVPEEPVAALEPFRIANQYGLFAVMTRGRYEIEFQGSQDGQNWQAYTFMYKPQILNERPGIYAPYQPRFDWNLWFASLGEWRQNDIVPFTEERLLENDRDVLALFRTNPFAGAPPRYVRAVLWQYWFTTIEEKRSTGNWWRRSLLGVYAPTLMRMADGQFGIVQPADELAPHD
jgi:hypothetical protein